MEKPEHLIVAAESGIQIGTGHVMRCLALAQAWKRSGGQVSFVVRGGQLGIEERLRAEGMLVRTLPRNASPGDLVQLAIGIASTEASSTIAVLDGYGFGTREQQEFRTADIRVLMLDDYGHAAEYPARWVLNQHAYAATGAYHGTSSDTRFLMGPRYVLLRDEFRSWMGWKRSNPQQARKILITMGGSDPENASENILRSLASAHRKDKKRGQELEVVLVIGGSNPHKEALRRAADDCPVAVRLVRSAEDMPALMAWADVAIAGAGGTAHELCFMGLPSLLLVVAENQRRIAERLSELGLAVNGGTTEAFHAESFAGELQALLDSCERREQMSRDARAFVDGLGSERVCGALRNRELMFRPARAGDCQRLFDWAVDAGTRAASFDAAPISWERHSRWFEERMGDAGSAIRIGETLDGQPVGVTRFQIGDGVAVMSISVAPEFRGQGWGRELIKLSTGELVRAGNVRRVDALVKPDNHASVRVFEASGFTRVAAQTVADQEALRFTWECGT